MMKCCNTFLFFPYFCFAKHNSNKELMGSMLEAIRLFRKKIKF